MVRIAAFALNADDALEFGRGLSTEDEPDLWRKDLTGAIELWIDVGLPDEKWIRKACGRAAQVAVYAYGGAKADVWWSQNAPALAKLRNLSVWLLDADATASMLPLVSRTMKLGATIQEGQLMLTSEAGAAVLEPRLLKAAGAR